MDSLNYRGVLFRIIDSRGWEREAITDDSNTTYLHTRWRGSVILTYNPGPNPIPSTGPTPTSYQQVAGVGPVPTAGRFPAQTDAAIRAFLEQPRGQLVVMSAGNVVISTPSPTPLNTGNQPLNPPTNAPAGLTFLSGKQTDANNGPFLRVNSIAQIPGERLWKIHLDIECYVNETPSPFLITSNRWAVHSDIDWQHVTTRTYEGVCTVRADLLNTVPNLVGGGINPFMPATSPGPYIDQFRNVFASFSVPPNFQRTHVHVSVTPDGNSVRYRIVDTEQLFNKNQLLNSIPRLECQDTNWVWFAQWGRQVAGMANSIATQTIPGIIRGIGQALDGNIVGAIGSGWSAVNAPMKEGAQRLPKRYRNCVVRAWGDRSIHRAYLVDLCMGVASARIGAPALFDTTSHEILVSQDSNNHVTVSWTSMWNFNDNFTGFPAAEFLLASVAVFAPGLGLLPDIGGGDWAGSLTATATTTAQGFLPWGTVLSQQQGTAPNNPQFYDQGIVPGSGTRGTYLQPLVTQVLESFNTPPAGVP